MKRLTAVFLALLVLSGSPALAGEGVTVLVTGANRGIGLEYAKQFSAKGYTVIGTARKPGQADELDVVADRVEQLDVADPKSVAALAERLDGVAIDILINNAGIFERQDVTIDEVDFDMMERTYAVNTLGPLRVTKALLPNLRAGKSKVVISMSSGLGSIEKSNGRWYAYRSSKTALNQINKIWSVELGPEGFICTVLHPGWVRTDMGGSNATYSPEESVAGLIQVIEGLDAEDNGRFYDFQGNAIPW
ncbi:MAG: SDR family oxidoreductase [Gammaproteobacteria bacterium]|jgi:NAD(P)-dependent dehydrogenase (short-subunit alcohol dehydrogenase family)